MLVKLCTVVCTGAAPVRVRIIEFVSITDKQPSLSFNSE